MAVSAGDLLWTPPADIAARSQISGSRARASAAARRGPALSLRRHVWLDATAPERLCRPPHPRDPAAQGAQGLRQDRPRSKNGWPTPPAPRCFVTRSAPTKPDGHKASWATTSCSPSSATSRSAGSPRSPASALTAPRSTTFSSGSPHNRVEVAERLPQPAASGIFSTGLTTVPAAASSAACWMSSNA
jgi:hypothetical protein